MRIFVVLFLLSLSVMLSANAQQQKTKAQIRAEHHLLSLLNHHFEKEPHNDDFVLVIPFAISLEGILSYTIHEQEANLTYRLEVPLALVEGLFLDMYFSLETTAPVVKQFILRNEVFEEFKPNNPLLFYLNIYGENNDKLKNKIEKSLKKALVYYGQK